MMTNQTVHVAIFDRMADWEVGHLLVELRTGRFTGQQFDVATVSESRDAVTTMGGFRLLPDLRLADLRSTDSSLLILPGGEMWDAGAGEAYATAAGAFIEAGIPVAAICGGTAGLARAGLLDERLHTSAAPEYLAATGYAGGHMYVDQRAVAGRGVITAGPQSPVQFATTTLSQLGLAPDPVLEAYERLFSDGDATAFPILMGDAA